MFHRQPLEAENVEKQNSEISKNQEKEVEKTMGESQQNEVESQQTSDTRQSETAGGMPAGAASFKKPSTPSPRMPNNFAGAYPGAPSNASSSSTASSSPYVSSNMNRRLVVGEGINMSGEIDSCDMLIVEGTVEAALKGASHLDVTETGVFYGTVEIDEATISGRFEGDIVVNGRLTVTETGSIIGSIAYKELSIEAGATVDGKIMPLSSVSGAKTSKDKTIKGSGPKNDNQGEGELPFANTQASG